MKFLLLIVSLMAIASSGSAQSSMPDAGKVDSVRALIRQSRGAEKATQLAALAILYSPYSTDSAKALLENALEICRVEKNDTAMVVLICKAANALSDNGERELVQHYLVMARDLQSTEAQRPDLQARVFRELFEVHYWNFNDFDSCIYYARRWIDVAPDSVNRAWAYTELGVSYAESGNHTKALEAYHTAQNLLQSSKVDPWYVSHVYNNLGMLYSDEREFQKAESYFLKALDYSHQTGYTPYNVPELNNLAVLYMWMGQYEKSLEYLAMVTDLLPEYNDPWTSYNNLLNIGNALTLSGKPKEGLQKYNASLAGFMSLRDDDKIASLRRLMAEAYRLLGDYRNAEKEALLALEWDRKNGYGDIEKESYSELYKIYGATGQFAKAFDYQSRYLKIVDSLNSAERRTKFGLVEKNYEIEIQEQKRQQLERENAIHLAQARADRTTRVALMIGALLLGIAAVVAVLAYRRSRRQNITLNIQNKKIEEQAQQLEEAAKTKARFFANVSHELRTPVTLLNGMLELMRENQAHVIADEKMDIALGNSRRLQNMLDEVLDLSRVETGKWELKKASREILPLLNRVVFAFESLMVRKNLKLYFDARALEGLVLELDEDKFEKIINNLVYNAIKFNHEGGWVRVTGYHTNNVVSIEVADSGIGIPEKELPLVFDRFYQSTSTGKLNAQGIGIGLSLVREFTELHGGTVSVSSRLNEGSIFTIQLPIRHAAVASSDVTDDGPELAEIDFSALRQKPVILIVEDNDEMRYYLQEILGHNVTIAEARHGREALQWLKANKPDLIISDVMMPEMDGLEFLSQLKTAPLLRGIPVVMLTARAAEEDVLQGLSLGIDDYIIKPFNAKELKIRIHNLLLNQEIRREWSQKPAEAEEEFVPSVPSEDEQFLEKVRTFVEEQAGNSSLGIADLADHMAMSERQIYRKAATLTGMTPAHLIKEIRLKIAYRLLLERKVVKVADLSKRVGFENSSYFSRQFYERYGKRPTEFL